MRSTARRTARPLIIALVAAAGVLAPGATATAGQPSAVSTYDTAVLADDPVGYWQMSNAAAASEPDASGHGRTGTYTGNRASVALPNGDNAADFDGATGYLQIADNAVLSPATTGEFTIEAWMRPDTLQFDNFEGSGYVHWMGKGTPNQHEYVARMYNQTNDEDRPNRISGYSFNLDGGLGAGSYFQDPVTTTAWIHYVLVINPSATSSAYPNGYTKVYRDGVLRDQDQLSINGIVITPADGTAPLRIGTRDLGSFFDGAVGKVAVYDNELSPERIKAHTDAMTAGGQ